MFLRTVTITIVILLILTGVSSYTLHNIDTGDETSLEYSIDVLIEGMYADPLLEIKVDASPFRIDGNHDFLLLGLNGSGIPSDPWILEGLSINGSGWGCSLYIGNTTDHFIVRQSDLFSGSGLGYWPYFPNSGLYLYNVTNGLVSDNTLSFGQWNGLTLYLCENVTVKNNLVHDNLDEGMSFFEA